MNKEEILERSRQENKNKDIYVNEINVKGGNIATIVGLILTTIIFISEVLLGFGINYGLYGIVFSVTGTSNLYRAIKLNKNKVIPIFTLIISIIFIIVHIYNLISKSTII